MLSGVQTGNGTPHDKYDIRGIARAHKQKRQHFHAKTTSAKLYIYIGVGSRDLFIDKAHTALDIFRFAAFFSHCLIPFNCLNLFKIFNSVWKCSTHAVMNNFWLVSLTCLGWFRVVQNGSNGLKRLKKSSLFSNNA